MAVTAVFMQPAMVVMAWKNRACKAAKGVESKSRKARKRRSVAAGMTTKFVSKKYEEKRPK